MKRTKRRGRRSEAEIRALVAGYENGNQSRREYCDAHGLAVTTLDYYRRRFRPAGASLVEIDLQSVRWAHRENGGITVFLGNGRRLEIEWADLALVAGHSQSLRALVGCLEGA